MISQSYTESAILVSLCDKYAKYFTCLSSNIYFQLDLSH